MNRFLHWLTMGSRIRKVTSDMKSEMITLLAVENQALRRQKWIRNEKLQNR